MSDQNDQVSQNMVNADSNAATPGDSIDEEWPESRVVSIKLDVDIGSKSNMFFCVICMNIIDDPNTHRTCGAGCGAAVCKPCLGELHEQEMKANGMGRSNNRLREMKPVKCPNCRSLAPFVQNPIVKLIYPQIVMKCKFAECTVKALNLSSHMKQCRYRDVRCPVCHEMTPIEGISAHIRTKCIINGDDVKEEPYGSLESILRIVPDLPAKAWMRIISLNPRGVNVPSRDARILILWRKNNPILGFIRMLCIHLCASPLEKIRYAITESGQEFQLPIATFDNFESVQPTVESGVAIKLFKEIAIPYGPHSLTCGESYRVRETPYSSGIVMTLLEILWAPTRAVFVGSLGTMRTIQINSNMRDMIIPMDEKFEVAENHGRSHSAILSMAGGDLSGVLNFPDIDPSSFAGMMSGEPMVARELFTSSRHWTENNSSVSGGPRYADGDSIMQSYSDLFGMTRERDMGNMVREMATQFLSSYPNSAQAEANGQNEQKNDATGTTSTTSGTTTTASANITSSSSNSSPDSFSAETSRMMRNAMNRLYGFSQNQGSTSATSTTSMSSSATTTTSGRNAMERRVAEITERYSANPLRIVPRPDSAMERQMAEMLDRHYLTSPDFNPLPATRRYRGGHRVIPSTYFADLESTSDDASSGDDDLPGLIPNDQTSAAVVSEFAQMLDEDEMPPLESANAVDEELD